MHHPSRGRGVVSEVSSVVAVTFDSGEMHKYSAASALAKLQLQPEPLKLQHACAAEDGGSDAAAVVLHVSAAGDLVDADASNAAAAAGLTVSAEARVLAVRQNTEVRQCNARQIDALPNAAPFCAVATCVPTQQTRVTIAQPFVRYRVTTTEWGTG